MKLIIYFLIICCFSTANSSKDAVCDYRDEFFNNTVLSHYNSFAYACFLKTEKSRDSKSTISNIIGDHELGKQDDHVVSITSEDNIDALTQIFCQKFKNLIAIDLKEPTLTSINKNALKNCRKLERFSMSDTRMSEVSELSFAANTNLKIISLIRNDLKTLPEELLESQSKLRLLFLSYNSISGLPSNIFTELHKLEGLYLDNNKLEILDPEWFENLQNLKDLFIDWNLISEIQDGVFRQLTNLRSLSLQTNRIRFINSNSFQGLQELRNLNLAENFINELPPNVFTPTISINYIELQNNILSVLQYNSFQGHSALFNLNFAFNYINAIDEDIFENININTLSLTGNVCSNDEFISINTFLNLIQKCLDNYKALYNFVPELPPPPLPPTYPGLTDTNEDFKVFFRNLDGNDDKCGKPIIGQGNIIGGKDTAHGDFPWIAALTKSSKFFCGGILISTRKVVTAAHCVQEKGTSEPFKSQELVVLLGAYDLDIIHEPGRSTFAVQKIEIHPDWLYQSDQYDADIAVLVLVGKVTFTNYIQPICLNNKLNISSATRGVVVGYGKSEDRTKIHENKPRVIDTPIFENKDCFKKNIDLKTISSGRTFCGGDGNGTGVCKGDSGGGLYVIDEGFYYLRGIVSSSLKTAELSCDVNNYSVFTNVLKFIDWINGISVDL